MRKLFVLILSLLLLISLLASCDQGTVDKARSDLLDKTSDALDPFFKEASSVADSSLIDDNATDVSSEDLGDSADVEPLS